MHRLKQRRTFSFGIEVGRWGKPHRSHNRRAQVRKNVAEEIRSDHNIEPIRMGYEMCGQNIDVVLVRFDIGILR